MNIRTIAVKSTFGLFSLIFALSFTGVKLASANVVFSPPLDNSLTRDSNITWICDDAGVWNGSLSPITANRIVVSIRSDGKHQSNNPCYSSGPGGVLGLNGGSTAGTISDAFGGPGTFYVAELNLSWGSAIPTGSIRNLRASPAYVNDISFIIGTPDLRALTEAIAASQAVLDASVEGTGEGQYPPPLAPLHNAYQTAIGQATAVRDNPASGQAEYNNAGVELSRAEAIFNAAMVPFQTPVPSFPATGQIALANNTLVKTAGSGTVYMVDNGLLRPFTSVAVFRARGLKFSDVQIIGPDLVIAANLGLPVRYPNGTLIRGTGPTVYLVSGDSKLGITSMESFRRMNLSLSKIVRVNDGDLASYPDGGVAQ